MKNLDSLPTTWVKLADLKPGVRLQADDGFTCISPGTICTVQADHKGYLFVPCKHGGHWLGGQLNDHDELIGFTLVVD